jgi:hypothetical protein
VVGSECGGRHAQRRSGQLDHEPRGQHPHPGLLCRFIGFYGHANLPDGNTAPNGPNLTTGGAALIKANRAKIIQMYTTYAQQVHAVWPTKPLVWLLEGDFIQYQGTSQSSPLTWAELGQLGADITCAIKTNMPNAVVAINHSTWNANADTNSFWGAMKTASVNYDLVWTSGEANANGFFNSTITPGGYNAATGTYAYVRTLTGARSSSTPASARRRSATPGRPRRPPPSTRASPTASSPPTSPRPRRRTSRPPSPAWPRPSAPSARSEFTQVGCGSKRAGNERPLGSLRNQGD